MTTKRNLEKELNYYVYNDPEYGEDIEHICYPSLICILKELVEKIEQIEQRLDKEDDYRAEQND